MSQIISLTVHGRTYQIATDEGKEAHLQKLAEHIDRRMAEQEARVGHVGEQRLLFMACLLIADELFDAQRQVDGLKAGRLPPAAVAAPAAASVVEEQAALALDACAQRIEAIAARLQGA